MTSAVVSPRRQRSLALPDETNKTLTVRIHRLTQAAHDLVLEKLCDAQRNADRFPQQRSDADFQNRLILNSLKSGDLTAGSRGPPSSVIQLYSCAKQSA